MNRLPASVLQRMHDKARLEGESESPFRYPASASQKLEWLGSATLRAPAPGHIDIVALGRRARG